MRSVSSFAILVALLLIKNIGFGQNCSGLVGGTTTTPASSYCTSVAFTVSVTGGNSGTTFSYQWQQSRDGVNWIDRTVFGQGESLTLPGGIDTATYFRRRTTCGTIAPVFSTALQVVLSPALGCACTPAATNCSQNRITQLSIGSFGNSSSACSASGYADFTNLGPINASAGQSLSIVATTTSRPANMFVIVWTDFNSNGIFNLNEGEILTPNSPTTSSGFIRIPPTARTAVVRMRVTFGNYDLYNDGYGPCQPGANSDVEDYLLNIGSTTLQTTNRSWYVNASASGTYSTGNSWTSSFKTIPQALRHAGYGDTVHVAAGIYEPQFASGIPLLDGVKLLGGYPATGNPSFQERHPGIYPTVIDGWGPTLMSINLFKGANLGSETYVSGFHLVNSSASVSSTGGGLLLQNCRNPIFDQIVLRSNQKASIGSAVALYNSSATFRNIYIDSNINYGGQSIVYIAGGLADSVRFINSVITNNSAKSILYVAGGTAILSHTTMAGNALAEPLVRADSGVRIALENNLFAGNLWGDQSNNAMFPTAKLEFSADSANNVLARGNVFQAARLSGNKTISDPRFNNPKKLAGLDNRFFTEDDGFQLEAPCSPAINRGISTAVRFATDVLSRPRIVGSAPDAGAFENPSGTLVRKSTIFLKAGASGANDGSSWANAYSTLARAVADCADTLKIASGTYFPHDSDVTKFVVLDADTKWLGGYPNVGSPTDGQRNPAINPTVLSGAYPKALGGAKAVKLLEVRSADSSSILDGLTFTNNTLFYPYEPALKLVNCRGSKLERLTFKGLEGYGLHVNASTAIQLNRLQFLDNRGQQGLELFKLVNCDSIRIDSLFAKGNAITANQPSVLTLRASSASISRSRLDSNTAIPIYALNSKLTLSETHVNGNVVPILLARGIFSSNSQLNFSKCVFEDSSLPANHGPRSPFITLTNGSSVTAYQTVFKAAATGLEGSSILADSSRVTIKNCVFLNDKRSIYAARNSTVAVENTVAYGGPGEGDFVQPDIYFAKSVRSSLNITNVTIVRYGNGRGVIVLDSVSPHAIVNTIFHQNYFNSTIDTAVLNNRRDVYREGSGNANISFTRTEYRAYTGTGNMLGGQPRFENLDNLIGPDKIWFTADDGYRLCRCSPLLNRGSNSAVATLVEDIMGGARVFGSTVDMGAAETQLNADANYGKVAFVRSDAAPTGDGLTWATAFPSFQKGLDFGCADTVKVSAGTYRPSANDRSAQFTLSKRAVVLGGFPATGAPSNAQRQVDDFPTILSANIGDTSLTTDNTYSLMYIRDVDTSTLDGFWIQGAASASSTLRYPNREAALVLDNCNRFSISNNRFLSNIGLRSGALATFSSTNTQILRNVFKNNYGYNGALCVTEDNGLHNIVNNVFAENQGAEGGGLSLYSFTNVRQNIFLSNHAQKGGALYIGNFATYPITNNTFFRNTTDASFCMRGASVFVVDNGLTSTGPVIRNCIFRADSIKASFGTFHSYNYNDWFKQTSYHCNWAFLPDLNLSHSAVYTNTTNPLALINESTIEFVNPSNPIGPDGKWFTADDGLQLAACSEGINGGLNSAATSLSTDILGKPRVVGTTVDLGAYEFDGSPGPGRLFMTANDSATANKEFTDAAGWTHYYRNCDYLLSVRKNGRTIGTVGQAGFQVKVVNAMGSGSGQGITISNPSYANGQGNYLTARRSFKFKWINATSADSLQVALPIAERDLVDMRGGAPTLQRLNEAQVLQVAGPQSVYAPNLSAGQFQFANHGSPLSRTRFAVDQIGSSPRALVFAQRWDSLSMTIGLWPARLLAARFIGLTAKPVDHHIQLTWEATNLAQTQLFNIKRAKVGESWQHLAYVRAQPGQQAYSFEDKTVLSNQRYQYQIEALEITGERSLSQVAEAIIIQKARLSLSPNPATNLSQFTWQGSNSQPCNVRLLNSAGVELNRWNSLPAQGQLKIPTASLPSGIYKLIFQQGEELQSLNLLVQH